MELTILCRGLNSLYSTSDLYFIINILNRLYGRVNFINLVIFLLHIFLISNNLVQFLIAIVFFNHIKAFSPLLFHPPTSVHTQILFYIKAGKEHTLGVVK